MKIVPKFVGGGEFSPFFTLYTATETPKQATSSGSSKESKKSSDGELTEKDFFNMFKDLDGLPNEMNSIVSDLIGVFQLSNLTGLDNNNLATTYLSNLFRIKIAAQNKKKYDTALEVAKKNGSMAEPAITMDGKILAMTPDKKVEAIDLDTLYNGEKQYMPLTVSNLANMRAYDPSLMKDQESFNIIENSMGFEAFQDILDKAKINLTQSEYSESGSFSINGAAREGLRSLQRLSKEDQQKAFASIIANGLYDYTSTQKDNISQIQELVKYMYTVLPKRAKVWASLKTGNPNQEEASVQLISNYLMGKRANSKTFNIQYKGIPKDPNDSSSKTSKDEEETKMTFLTAVQNGYGERIEQRSLNLGNNTNFKVTGSAYGAVADLEGKALSDLTLQQLLDQTGISGISNKNSITFGDNVLNPNQFNNIAIENTGGFRAVLPVTKQGTKVIPNFDLMNSFDKVVQEVNRELGENSSYDDRLKLLEKKIQGIPALQELLTMSGKLDQNKFQPFLIVDGIASDRNFEFTSNTGASISDEDNPLIRLTDNQQDIEYFNRITKPEDFDEDSYLPWDWFGMYDKVYKSNIFIPLQTNNRLAAIIFSGQKIPTDTAYEIQKEYQQSNAGQMKSTSSNMLFK